MPIEVGDQIIHPRHGLGQVTRLAVKQFVEGNKRPFYEISFSNSTLWVPLSSVSSGIRKLAGKNEVASGRKVLKSPAEPLENDYRSLQTALKNQLKEGTLTARCEVVRDLTAHSLHKPLNGTISFFLQNTLDILCQEWAAVEGITPEEAATEIQTLLEKGKPTNDNE